MALLFQRVGLSTASMAPSLLNRAETWRVNITSQTTLQEELKKALLACGCALVPTSTGQAAALDYYDLKAPLVLNASQSDGPVIRDYSQLAVAPPVYQVIVSAEPCWSVNSEQEITPDEARAILIKAFVSVPDLDAEMRTLLAKLIAPQPKKKRLWRR